MSEKQYETLFNKLNKLNQDNDNEASHILQNKIYRKFIKDIINDKFTTMTIIKKFAKNMNKYVVKEDKGRWYA
jgi:hypothetical protein